MDVDRVDSAALVDRLLRRWPGHHRHALGVVPSREDYAYTPRSNAQARSWARPGPNVWHDGWRGDWNRYALRR